MPFHSPVDHGSRQHLAISPGCIQIPAGHMGQLKSPGVRNVDLALSERLESLMPLLSKCETKVARICVEDPIEFTKLTVKEISRMAHVSPPTVLRFCRSIGYAGFADMKCRFGKEWP